MPACQRCPGRSGSSGLRGGRGRAGDHNLSTTSDCAEGCGLRRCAGRGRRALESARKGLSQIEHILDCAEAAASRRTPAAAVHIRDGHVASGDQFLQVLKEGEAFTLDDHHRAL
eukprot:7381751-Prymnesium_polylepis.1